MAVSEMNDIGHNVFLRTRTTRAETRSWSSRGRMGLRVAGLACSIPAEHFEAQQHRRILFTDARADRKLDGENFEDRAAKVIGACNAVSPTDGARLDALSVGGGSGIGDQSSDVIYPTTGDGLLGERPMVPGGRERAQLEDEL